MNGRIAKDEAHVRYVAKQNQESNRTLGTALLRSVLCLLSVATMPLQRAPSERSWNAPRLTVPFLHSRSPEDYCHRPIWKSRRRTREYHLFNVVGLWEWKIW